MQGIIIRMHLKILKNWSYKNNNMSNNIAVGRRKASVARVRFIKGKGNIKINNRTPKEYFKRESLVMEFKEPLAIVDFNNKITEIASDKDRYIKLSESAIKSASVFTTQNFYFSMMDKIQ